MEFSSEQFYDGQATPRREATAGLDAYDLSCAPDLLVEFWPGFWLQEITIPKAAHRQPSAEEGPVARAPAQPLSRPGEHEGDRSTSAVMAPHRAQINYLTPSRKTTS
jgi:hypothetical protein